MELTQDYDNRTFEDTIWTNRRELNSITEYYDEMASSFRDNFPSLDKIDGNIKKDNLYIILGNATRQLYRVFKEKNVNFMHSKVINSIVRYFRGLEKEAMIHFSNYVNMIDMYVSDLEKSVSPENKNNSFIDKIPFLKQKENRIVPVLNKEKMQKEIDIYNNIANQIVFFDIEKNIEQAVNYYFDWTMSQDEFKGLNINKEIDSINQELSSLGINKKIEHRENIEEKNYNIEDLEKELLDKFKKMEEYLKNEYKDDAETAEIIETMEKYKNDINQSNPSIDNKTGRRV